MTDDTASHDRPTGHSASQPPALSGRTLAILLVINGVLICGFFGLRYATQAVVSPNEVMVVCLSTGGLMMLGLVALRLARVRTIAALAHVFTLLTALSVFLMEGLFWAVPALVPDILGHRDPSLLEKFTFVEYLEEAPWVRFKANTKVTLPDVRGDDFARHWITDRRGFKNTTAIANRTSFTALAIGDSYTESMGEPIETAWPTRVSAAGYPIYNTGVQGYAPVQALATLKTLGPEISFPMAILGYTPGFAARNLQYTRNLTAKVKEYTGGIGALEFIERENRNMLRYEYFPAANQVLDLIQHLIGRTVTRVRYLWRSLQFDDAETYGQFAPYVEKVRRSASIRLLADGIELGLAGETLEKFARLARAMSVTPVLIYFINRDVAYYPVIMNRPLPEDHRESIRRRFILRKSVDLGISVIDMTDTIQGYMATLRAAYTKNGRPIPWAKLPYHKVDGHYSRIGNQLVADQVVEFLRRKGLRPDPG